MVTVHRMIRHSNLLKPDSSRFDNIKYVISRSLDGESLDGESLGGESKQCSGIHSCRHGGSRSVIEDRLYV